MATNFWLPLNQQKLIPVAVSILWGIEKLTSNWSSTNAGNWSKVGPVDVEIIGLPGIVEEEKNINDK